MGRIRTIKPELPQSESMGRVSRDARLCFIMLWTIVDDDGRARGNSRMLASLLYPYDDDAGALMGGWLEELETEGCITRYQVAGDWYLEVKNWRKHQKIDHPTGSRLPPKPAILASPREDSRSLAPDLGPRTSTSTSTSTSTKDQGPISAHDALFNDFWKAYPRKKGKGQAERAWTAAVKSAAPEEIIAGLLRVKWPSDPQFIKHPATWLNGRCWLDEPDPLSNREASLAVLNQIIAGEVH